MLSLADLTDLYNAIQLLVVYLITIAIAGCFKAWTAHKLGDDTAQSFGFLTLNPLAHIATLDFIFLWLLNIGIGQRIPVNFENLSYSFRKLKGILIVFAPVVAYLSIAIACVLGLFILGNPMPSSFAYTCALLLQAFVQFATLLATLRVLFGVIELLPLFLQDFSEMILENIRLGILALLLVMSLLGFHFLDYIQLYLKIFVFTCSATIFSGGHTLAHAFGLL